MAEEKLSVLEKRKMEMEDVTPQSAERSERSPAEVAKETLSKWLYIADPQALDIILATGAAIFLPGDPLWTLVIGPSGGGKTEMINMFSESEDTEVISKLTPNTLMSGLKDIKPGDDLIHTLSGKLVVIKDLAPILEMGRDAQREIFSDLRDAYDGLIRRVWGSGKEPAEWRGRFGLIAAATAAIDRNWKFFAELGERYCRVNLRTDPEAQTAAAIELMGKEDALREEIREAGRLLLATAKKIGRWWRAVFASLFQEHSR